MKLPKIIKNIVLLGSALLSSALVAQETSLLPCDEVEKEVRERTPEAEVAKITAFVPAVTIERVPPRYPKSSARAGAEGWVQMSYVIDTEGNVVDPVVEDFGGHRDFQRSALRAIKKWKFDPALKDGKPTEQCHQSVQFDFILDGNNGASRGFVSDYKKANSLIDAQDYAGAQELITEMHERDYKNRYENAWVWSLDSKLAASLKDKKREANSIQRTLASSSTHKEENRTFNDEYIGYMHQRLYSLQATLGKFGDALDTLEKIQNMPNAAELLKPLEGLTNGINDMVASQDNIFIDANLNDSGKYFHKLTRSQFGFVDVKGKLDSIEVRCESRREKYTVAEGFIWSIPASWGRCQVLVSGDKDTSFSLVETPTLT
jgi:TonB family protein